MATITGFTAARMKQIEDKSVIGGSVNNMGNLILMTRDGGNIDAGNLKGPQGDIGPQGIAGISGGTPAKRDSIYGVPTMEFTQVALANAVVTWFNVTTGKVEAYYAPTGALGLTVPGLPSGTPAGWYPIPANREQQMAFTTAAPVAWPAGPSSDAGPLVLDATDGVSSQRSSLPPTFAAAGSVSGSLKFTEPGIYTVTWYNLAQSDPGTAGYRIVALNQSTWNPNGGINPQWEVFGQTQRQTGAPYWDSMTLAENLRVPLANLEIRFTGIQVNASNNYAKIKVRKVAAI